MKAVAVPIAVAGLLPVAVAGRFPVAVPGLFPIAVAERGRVVGGGGEDEGGLAVLEEKI